MLLECIWINVPKSKKWENTKMSQNNLIVIADEGFTWLTHSYTDFFHQ